MKENTNGKFITLTFSNENITELNNQIPKTYKDRKGNEIELVGYKRDNAIATKAVHLFRERWRKEYKKSPRHWLVTELGHKGTENIHIHGIIWTNESFKTIRQKWNYGYIYPREHQERENYVNNISINYIVKYVNKIDKDHRYYKQIILSSPGIGGNYKNTFNAQKNEYSYSKETIETYTTYTGHKIALPTYWRNHIYTEEQREMLWINKLNKEERYICGEKIDISKETETYFETLKWYQEKNKRLGYGNNMKDWKREEYETIRRIKMLEKRITMNSGKTN